MYASHLPVKRLNVRTTFSPNGVSGEPPVNLNSSSPESAMVYPCLTQQSFTAQATLTDDLGKGDGGSKDDRKGDQEDVLRFSAFAHRVSRDPP